MTIIGLILSFLSVIALIKPKTPLGQKIQKCTFLHNEQFEKFYKLYESYAFYFLIFSLIFLFYLGWIALDFFKSNMVFISVLYLGTITFLFSAVLTKNTEIKYLLINIFEKWLLASLSFSILFIFTFFVFNSKLESGALNEKYDNISLIQNNKSYHNVSDFIKNYQNELLMLCYINIVKEYQTKDNFTYDLTNNLVQEDYNYHIFINRMKTFYNTRKYSNVFKSYINDAIKEKVNKKIVLFPIEIQPYFISNLLLSYFTFELSVVGIGSKIYIVEFFKQIKLHFSNIGLLILIILTSILAFYFTKIIVNYNQKYDKSRNFKMTLFFMTVSTFGLLLTIISLIYP